MKSFYCLLFLSFWAFPSWGGNEVYVDSLDVASYRTESGAATDTIWFVNYKFDEVYANMVDFRLKFTNYEALGLNGGQLSWQKINTLDGTDEGNPGSVNFSGLDNLLEMDDIEKGLYFWTFTFNDNSKAYAYFFNKNIEFEIDTVPGHFAQGNCINPEYGSDTCIFKLIKHKYNPKGTKYEMKGNLTDEDIQIDKEKPEGQEDMFYVVFNGATGYNDLFLNVTGSFENPRNRKTVYGVRQLPYPLRKYEVPKLFKIFGYDTTNMEELKGCVGSSLGSLPYSQDINKKYMDFLMTPDFKTKELFEITYYKKEQLEKEWEVIPKAQEFDYVNDSTGFTFKQPGIYRIWIATSNYCGEDTLDTEIVKQESGAKTKGRPIKIFRNDLEDMEFKNPWLCLSGESHTDTLVIKDNAYRLKWEPLPEYSIVVYEKLKNEAGGDSLVLIKQEKQAEYYEFLPVEFSELNTTTLQYDSAIVKCVFRKKGHYRLVLSKYTTECGLVMDSVLVRAGEEPVLAEKFLDQSGGGDVGSLNTYGFCGPYAYSLPVTITADSNYALVNKYEWKFGKAGKVDQYDEAYPEIEGGHVVQFDSLGEKPSYITLRVGNRCGWSEIDSVSFFTFKKPNVVLWRDSLPENDTLCAGRSYKYYFKGEFPESFIIAPDGQLNDSVISVFWPESTTLDEKYTIKNAAHPDECYQEIAGPVEFVAPPQFNVMDTVDFCSSTSEIQTHALLTTAVLGFKNLFWKFIDPLSGASFNTGDGFPDGFDDEKKNFFPSFSVNQDKTVLGYTVVTGGGFEVLPDGRKKGCYKEGDIVLRRHPEPVLALDHSQAWKQCENQPFSIEGVLGSNKEDALNLQITVDGESYFSSADGSWDIPLYTCPLDKDTVTIVFHAQQLHNYTGHEGCDIVDSVKLCISHPHINFLKQKDTVFSVDRIYHFERIRNYVDTAEVRNLTWSVEAGNGTVKQLQGGNAGDIFSRVYDFSGDATDSWVTFRLSGESPCGPKEGTLKVFYPLAKLTNGEAFLCDNVSRYALWGESEGSPEHIFGAFVDTASLEWTITSGAELGTIEGTKSAAKFVLDEHAGRGTVVIHCQVTPLTGGEPLEADLTLHFYKGPRITFAEGMRKELILAGSDTLFFPGVVTFTDYALKPVLSSFAAGTFDSDYYLPDYSGYDKYRDSVYVTLMVRDEDKAGCGEKVSATIPLLIYPNPAVSLDKDTLKMCKGDHITLGQINQGKFTIECDYSSYIPEWSARSGRTDCFSNPTASTITYQPDAAGYETIILTVNTTEEVTNYRNITRKLSAFDSLVVKAHGKPVFDISRRRDTICFGTTAVDITGIGVTTTAGDPVRFFKGPGLYNTTPPVPGKYELSEFADSAKVYITAIQEGCDNWIDEKDSVTILRLPELEVALQREADTVCSNKQLDILLEKANSDRIVWATKSGGLVAGQGALSALYTPVDGVLEDTVIVTVLPMLELCPDQKIVKQAVQVVPMPGLTLVNDTICAGVDKYAPELEESGLIQHIIWTSSSGGSFKDGANEVLHPVYLVSESDKAAGKVTLTAEIELRDPCSTVTPVERSMELTILEVPVLSYDAAQAVVCQGDSLLLDFVTFSPGVTDWEWTCVQGHYNDPTLVSPFFAPEENQGPVELKVTFTGEKTGTHACVAKDVPVMIQVNEAVAPGLIVPDTVCQYAEVVCTVDAEAVQYQWTTADGQSAPQREAIFYFSQTAQNPLALEVTYENSCKRFVSDSVWVNPAIEAEFKADSNIVGVGKTVHFTNETDHPATQWWLVEGVDFSHQKDFEHIFTSAGDYRVELVVRNAYGCRDTIPDFIKVIDRPVAKFNVTLDYPCDGAKATFENLSVGDPQYCSYKWVLNTNIESVDTTGIVPVGDVIYRASATQDTLYSVALMVENVAGADIAYQEIKVIAPVKPNLIPVEGVSKCGSFDRSFFNKTTGSADWYRIDWGDGTDTTFTELTSRQILHRYVNVTDETRTDTVRIFAGNVCTESDSMKLPIDIFPNPAKAVVGTNLTENCAPFEVTFSNKSIGFEESATVLWDFGEGNPMKEDNRKTVPHVYNQPGEYKVKMMIYDGCNKDVDSSVIIKVNGVNDKLAFRVEQDLQCSGQPVTFKVEPEIRDLFYDYQWNFNYAENPAGWDIASRNDTTASRVWNTPGSYQIALKAKSVGDNCQVLPFRKTVEVKLSPLADFHFSIHGADHDREYEINECSPLRIEFKNMGAAPSDYVEWDYGDGGSADGVTPLQHVYAEAGNYRMKMKITAENGCIDTLSKPLTVRNSPEALFSNRAGKLFCNGDQVMIDIRNLSEDREGVNYTWTYQIPGQTDYLPLDDSPEPPSFGLPVGTVGEVVLQLLASREGCEQRVTDTLWASAPIVTGDFSISKEQMCEGEETDFRIVTNGTDEVSWDLGDGSPLRDTTYFRHIYDGVGKYDVKLVVTNAYGCQEEMGRTLYVYPIPKADFSYEEDMGVYGDSELPAGIDISQLPAVKNGGISFVNYSSVDPVNFATGNLLYEWDFGDGSSRSAKAAPSHRFPNNGEYETWLYVRTEEAGCMDSTYAVISIDAVKGLFIPNAFAPGAGVAENPGVALFKPKGIGLLSYKIKVYDESGTCVWISDKLDEGRPAEGWDGTFNGGPLPKGLYKWEATAVFIDGSIWTGENDRTEGVVMLIR